MGFFKKKEVIETVEEPAAFTLPTPAVREGTTFLGKNLNIIGSIAGDDDVQLLGTHDGDTDLKGNLEISESAIIRGNIKAKTISVSGTVEGNIVADAKLQIRYTAQVRGNISTPVISVQEGAVFEGDVKMDEIRSD